MYRLQDRIKGLFLSRQCHDMLSETLGQNENFPRPNKELIYLGTAWREIFSRAG